MNTQQIPINEWDAMLPDVRSEFLRTNRLFLLRFIKEKEVKTYAVLAKYNDSVIVSKDSTAKQIFNLRTVDKNKE